MWQVRDVGLARDVLKPHVCAKARIGRVERVHNARRVAGMKTTKPIPAGLSLSCSQHASDHTMAASSDKSHTVITMQSQSR